MLLFNRTLLSFLLRCFEHWLLSLCHPYTYQSPLPSLLFPQSPVPLTLLSCTHFTGYPVFRSLLGWRRCVVSISLIRVFVNLMILRLMAKSNDGPNIYVVQTILRNSYLPAIRVSVCSPRQCGCVLVRRWRSHDSISTIHWRPCLLGPIYRVSESLWTTPLKKNNIAILYFTTQTVLILGIS